MFVNTPDLQAEGSHVDLHIYDLTTLLLRSERIDLTALETALTLLGIEVHLDAQENNLYYVTSTLNEGRISALGHTLAVHALETLGQGMDQGTIERVELQSSALGEVPNLFGIRFPWRHPSSTTVPMNTLSEELSRKPLWICLRSVHVLTFL